MAIVAVAVVSLVVLKVKGLRSFRSLLVKLYLEIRPKATDMLIVSLAAAFSEELFFRGTIQPLLGLWLTSLLFGLAHIGIPSKRGVFAFGLFVFGMGLFWGIVYEQLGILAAMTSHAIYDSGFIMVSKRYLAGKAA